MRCVVTLGLPCHFWSRFRITHISCNQPQIEITDTDNLSISEESRTVHITVSVHCVLYPDQETILYVGSTKISDGDVFIVSSARFISKAVVTATCLVRFTKGSATLMASNATSRPILLLEGDTVASVVNGEALSLVSLCVESPCQRPSHSGQASSTLVATISKDLTGREI